jgi:hypothetical protein
MTEARAAWPIRSAWALLEHAPASVDPLLQFGFRWLRPLAQPILPLELRRGRTRSGADGTLLVLGRGMLLEYLSRRFFVHEPMRKAEAGVPLHRVRRRLSRSVDRADLVLALVPRALGSHMAGDTLLQVPAYLDFVMAVRDVADLKAASTSLRWNVRKLRGSALVGRVSHDPAEFERFYGQFHRPLVDARHGDLGVRRPIRVLRRRFRFGGVLWIELDHVPWGGVVFEMRGDTMNMIISGRRSTGDAELDRRVSLATYLFSMDLARQRSCASINLGGTVPVLTDGLFRHKRAWGARATPRAETHTELLVGWRQPGSALLGFLAEAPLVYRSGRSLAALAAIAGDQAADPREGARLRRTLLADGIDRLTGMARNGWVPPERGWALPPPDALDLRTPLSSAALIAEPVP